MWRCFASGSGGDATPVNQIFNYVEVTPVVTSRSRQDVFIGTFNEILIPISNNPSDGSVTTELIGLEHELVDERRRWAKYSHADIRHAACRRQFWYR